VTTETDGIGTPGTNALTLSPEEESSLQRAVREAVRRQVVSMLERRGIGIPDDAQECPVCGDHVIILDEPPTFALDADGERICSACRAEQDFARMVRPHADIGGEGG
jgi:hypothetical protein